jgi:hypothetical protein
MPFNPPANVYLPLKYTGTAINATDFDGPVDVTFAAGLGNHRTVAITQKDDAQPEGDETAVLTLEPTDGYVGYPAFERTEIKVLDNEVLPTASIAFESAIIPNEGDGTRSGYLRVQLSDNALAPVKITLDFLSVPGNVDLIGVSDTLVIQAGNNQASADVRFVDNANFDGDQLLKLGIRSVTGAARLSGTRSDTAEVIVKDNEVGPALGLLSGGFGLNPQDTLILLDPQTSARSVVEVMSGVTPPRILQGLKTRVLMSAVSYDLAVVLLDNNGDRSAGEVVKVWNLSVGISTEISGLPGGILEMRLNQLGGDTLYVLTNSGDFYQAALTDPYPIATNTAWGPVVGATHFYPTGGGNFDYIQESQSSTWMLRRAGWSGSGTAPLWASADTVYSYAYPVIGFAVGKFLDTTRVILCTEGSHDGTVLERWTVETTDNRYLHSNLPGGTMCGRVGFASAPIANSPESIFWTLSDGSALSIVNTWYWNNGPSQEATGVDILDWTPLP